LLCDGYCIDWCGNMVLRIQQLDLRNGDIRSLTYSVFIARVFQDSFVISLQRKNSISCLLASEGQKSSYPLSAEHLDPSL
jgi:hypothetical protein